jgi:hypothetical protein
MDRPLLYLPAAETEKDTGGETSVRVMVAAAGAMGADWQAVDDGEREVRVVVERYSAAGAIARGSGASFIALGFRAREGESTMDLWSK